MVRKTRSAYPLENASSSPEKVASVQRLNPSCGLKQTAFLDDECLQTGFPETIQALSGEPPGENRVQPSANRALLNYTGI